MIEIEVIKFNYRSRWWFQIIPTWGNDRIWRCFSARSQLSLFFLGKLCRFPRWFKTHISSEKDGTPCCKLSWSWKIHHFDGIYQERWWDFPWHLLVYRSVCSVFHSEHQCLLHPGGFSLTELSSLVIPSSWRTGGGNSNIFHFHPGFLGRWSNLTCAYFSELAESIWKKV